MQPLLSRYNDISSFCACIRTGTPDSLYVRTVDSDIVILVIRFFTTLGLLELLGWLREWEKLRDIPIHDICSDLGPSRSMALPLFHAITGCDTISHFLGGGKKTAGASWQNTPGLTETLLALTNTSSCFSLGSLHMQKLERFVVITYSRGCGLAKVNEARHRLFTSAKNTLENMPPSRAALFEHTKRALLQASFYWNRATLVHQEIPDFLEWGGKGDTMVFGCLTGQHTKMPVKLSPSSCTATSKGLAQETVNAVELESISLGCVNVKVDV